MPRFYATISLIALLVAATVVPCQAADSAGATANPSDSVSEAEQAPTEAAPTEGAETSTEDELVQACREAKSQFHPITDEDVAKAKADAVAAVDELDSRFREEEDGAAAWRAFLHFEELQKELAKAVPDLDIVKKAYRRFAEDDQETLRYVWFLNAREALFRMLALRQAKDDPKLASTYKAHLKTLADALAQEKSAPNPATRAKIGRILGWLETAGQAPQLTAQIRDRFGYPNLYFWCSTAFLNEAVCRSVNEPTRVTDYILGTRVRGEGTTVGEVTAELVPCDEGGLVDVRFTGHTMTENVGVNGPATICSSSDTDFVAVKRLLIDRDGVACFPAVSTATTYSHFNSIRTNSPLPVVQRIATNRARQQKAQGERIASQHAETRLNRRVDEQFQERLAKANDVYESKVLQPLRRFRLSPETMRLSTTQEYFHCQILQARVDQIAAPGAPPAFAEGARLGFQIHESVINNTASSALAGVFLMEEDFHSLVEDLLGTLPEQLEKEKNEKPWGIDFCLDRPMWVGFGENQIRFGIRAKRFVRGEDTYPGMAVVVTYGISQADNGIVFLREEGFGVTPLDFAGREEKRLSAKETTIKTLLERRLEKLFEKKLVSKPLAFEGEWKKAGPLTLKRLEAKDGWLVGEYDKQAKPKD